MNRRKEKEGRRGRGLSRVLVGQIREPLRLVNLLKNAGGKESRFRLLSFPTLSLQEPIPW